MASQRLVILFLLVLVYWGYDTITNADRKYSNENYWKEATIQNITEVPDSALLPGNEYGSVLMFAASVNTNPQLIDELIKRGSDVNEVEPMFKGTPLSAAATKNPNPQIIYRLVRHGADVNARLSLGSTPLIQASMNNKNQGIVTALIKSGATPNTKDDLGFTALDYAKKHKNTVALNELQQ